MVLCFGGTGDCMLLFSLEVSSDIDKVTCNIFFLNPLLMNKRLTLILVNVGNTRQCLPVESTSRNLSLKLFILGLFKEHNIPHQGSCPWSFKSLNSPNRCTRKGSV